MVRTLNILLLLVTLAGLLFAWQARSEYDAARGEHQRLTAKVGRLPIEDESKAHVTALDTDDPLDFSWIVYLPAKFKAKWESVVLHGRSSTTNGGHSEAQTEIVRVRFRKMDGQWHVWRKFINSSGTHSINNIQFGELLDQSESLDIKQLGRDGVVTIEPDEVVTLLEISSRRGEDSKTFDEPLCTIRVGSQEAWAKQSK